MNILATFNDNDFEPTDYIDRPTVKAVILNDRDEVLLFSHNLPGGGVEKAETNEEALRRELMEEVGATVTIIRELGDTIAYRDVPKRRYVSVGYLCQLVSIESRTTNVAYEQGLSAQWEKRTDVIKNKQEHVADVKVKGSKVYQGDRYQMHIFNDEAEILFLKEAGK